MPGEKSEVVSKRSQSAEMRRYCARCSPGIFRRINRTSWMQRTLLTWLGFFPWECVSCRRVRFFRDSGKKQEAQVPA